MNDEHNSKLSKQYISSISQYFISENNITDSSNVTMFGCHGHISLGMSCQCGCDIVVLLSQSWSVAAAFSPVLVYFSCDGEYDREALNRNYFRPPLRILCFYPVRTSGASAFPLPRFVVNVARHTMVISSDGIEKTFVVFWNYRCPEMFGLIVCNDTSN